MLLLLRLLREVTAAVVANLLFLAEGLEWLLDLRGKHHDLRIAEQADPCLGPLPIPRL